MHYVMYFIIIIINIYFDILLFHRAVIINVHQNKTVFIITIFKIVLNNFRYNFSAIRLIYRTFVLLIVRVACNCFEDDHQMVAILGTKER